MLVPVTLIRTRPKVRTISAASSIPSACRASGEGSTVVNLEAGTSVRSRGRACYAKAHAGSL